MVVGVQILKHFRDLIVTVGKCLISPSQDVMTPHFENHNIWIMENR